MCGMYTHLDPRRNVEVGKNGDGMKLNMNAGYWWTANLTLGFLEDKAEGRENEPTTQETGAVTSVVRHLSPRAHGIHSHRWLSQGASDGLHPVVCNRVNSRAGGGAAQGGSIPGAADLT